MQANTIIIERLEEKEISEDASFMSELDLSTRRLKSERVSEHGVQNSKSQKISNTIKEQQSLSSI